MKVKIGDKEYGMVYSMRTIILFETIANKGFSVKTITDWLLLAYSAIVAKNKEAGITLDEFIEVMDLSKLNPIIEWLQKQMEVANQFVEQGEADDVKKK